MNLTTEERVRRWMLNAVKHLEMARMARTRAVTGVVYLQEDVAQRHTLAALRAVQTARSILGG